MKSLEKIAQTLIINGTLTEQPGLFYGKTGIAVFFFHYARQTGNKLYQNYAMDLIEEIQKQIMVTLSLRYDVGLAGIGVGFEYFLQNEFLEADDNDIFEDFDARMCRAAMYEPYPDLKLEGGLTGWGRYFICRLRGQGDKNNKLHTALIHIAGEISQKIVQRTVPKNEQLDVYRFFYDLTGLPSYSVKYRNEMQQCRKWEYICDQNIQTPPYPYLNSLQRLYICQNYFKKEFAEEIENEWTKWEDTDATLMDMGLLKGVSSNGLLHLTRLNRNNDSWFNLL